MSEGELQNLILEYLNLQPDFFAWRNNSTGLYDANKKIFRKKSGFNIAGVSDILSIFYPHGILFSVEVKKPGSRESSLSLHQRAFLNKISKMGGIAIWVQSLEEVINKVKEMRDIYGTQSIIHIAG